MNAAPTSTVTAGPPAPSGAMLHRDFPGWLPPMLVKELRRGLRTRGFVGVLVLFQLVMLLATLVSLSTQTATNASARAAGSVLTAFFWTIIVVQLLLVTPSRALGGLQAEVDTRTLDLLVLTRLNAWRIVLGKWFSLLAQATLLLIAMLPYLVVRYFTDNADIGDDVGRCLTLLGVSALLTAAALWASGMAKVLRVVIVILLAASLPTMAGGFGGVFFGRPFGGPGNPLARIFELPFDLFNAVFLGAFLLVSAVRNIAPPAENHCGFTRLLPLLALVPAGFAEVAGAHGLAVRQLYVAGGFLACVLLFELGSVRLPMASQWRPWERGGPLQRAIGWCSLPGWQSALVYGLAAVGAWTLLALIVMPTGTVMSRALAERAAALALLAATGLVFPAVIRSLVRPGFIPPGLVYAGALLLPVVLSWIALWLAESRWKITSVKAGVEVLPVAGFFFSASNPNLPAQTTVVQRIIALLVITAGLWQTRPYWQQLPRFEARNRATRLDA